MQDDNLKDLRELSWRRKLSPAEETQLRTWLEAHPEAQADWEAEAGLSDALNRLQEPPVPSNFTSRVLAAVEADAAREERTTDRRQSWNFWRWLPKAAVASLVLIAGLVGLQHYQHAQDEKRAQYARSVATISDVASLPSPGILEDFDAIHAMSQTVVVDEDLLKAFQ
jgi:negative regulator of sigma E activity